MDTAQSPLQQPNRPLPKLARFLFDKWIAPRSETDDERRQEFILNILLIASVILASACALIVHLNGSGHHVQPISLVVLAVFSSLLLASRRGYFRLSAYVLIAVYTLPLVFMTIGFGMDLPQILLSYAMLIIMSSVLLGTRSSFAFTLAISVFFGVLTYLYHLGQWTPNQSWRAEPFIVYDGLACIVTFGAMAIVSWLSNREIDKSLVRARHSEEALKQERDTLEIKVVERTEELRRAQAEQMAQHHRFVEFGRLASGLFHDLANPMTAVALNLESLKENSSQADQARLHLEQALKATKGLENFIASARKQLQSQESLETFSVAEQIQEVIAVLSHKAKKMSVDIRVQLSPSQKLYGNPLKFHQAMANLVSNAIDAYADQDHGQDRHPISIDAVCGLDNIIITITDRGCGMTEAQQQRVFEPFFTTKSIEAGMGIGLSSTKNIVEKDFHGTIAFTSIAGRGTSFTLKLPPAPATGAPRT